MKLTFYPSLKVNVKIYFVKVALSGFSPMRWRRLKIPGDTSLADLHQTMQILYAWEDEHLHQFHIYGKDYGLSYLGGVSFSDDARKVRIDDFEFDVGDQFRCEFNFYANWIIDIRIEKIEESEKPHKPYCHQGNRVIGFEKYDETEPTLNLLKAIAESDETTTLDDIYPYVEALNAVRFNIDYVNKRLKHELQSI